MTLSLIDQTRKQIPKLKLYSFIIKYFDILTYFFYEAEKLVKKNWLRGQNAKKCRNIKAFGQGRSLMQLRNIKTKGLTFYIL